MRIQFNPSLALKKQVTTPLQQDKKENITKSYSYNPISYKDYNVSFAARLFRTPQNFYEQDFNEANMPKTLHKYIYESVESDFRKTIPPAQAMKEVFGKISYAKDLDAVKKMFPDEPLFKDLSSTPKRKSREGLLGLLNLTKDDPNYVGKTLFKNGDNDLGLYILKKIYVEGKTLKEINKDFSKDVSVHFKSFEIRPQDYSAFGIKFPDKSFWHSFTATREDFPYVFIPRGPITAETSNRSSSSSNTYSTPKPVRKNKFDNIKDWEVEKLTDALIKGNGQKAETEKQIKKRNIQDKETQNFVAKYMGEINSIVLEKLHISDDMKDYFENYHDLSKTQKQKFDEYMKNEYINDLRSKVMSSTIRLFLATYGVDGNNEDFKELIEYAHNIKQNRIARNLEHDRIQAEYDAALGIFEEEKTVENIVKTKEIESSKNEENLVNTFKTEEELTTAKNKIINDFLKSANITMDEVETYKLETEDGPIEVLSTADAILEQSLRKEFMLLPRRYQNNLINAYKKHSLNTESFRYRALQKNTNLGIIPDERFLSEDEYKNASRTMFKSFAKKDFHAEYSAQQAILNSYIKEVNDLSDYIFRLTTHGLCELFNKLEPEDKASIYSNIDKINKDYAEYCKPIANSEMNKITNEMLQIVRDYNKDYKQTDTEYKDAYDIINGMRIALCGPNKRKYKEIFKDCFTDAVYMTGGSSRFLLDKNIPDVYKKIKLENMLTLYTNTYQGELFRYIMTDEGARNYFKIHNPVLYNSVRIIK